MYSKLQVQKHNTINDCWSIASHKVYNVTDFLVLHPEHIPIVLPKAGQDVTHDFRFHSKSMKKIWNAYCIGYVRPNICIIS